MDDSVKNDETGREERQGRPRWKQGTKSERSGEEQTKRRKGAVSGKWIGQ